MKKAIVWIAIMLVAFIPTYIIIFGGMKTAVPEMTLGEEELRPAMVRWVSEDSKPTSPLQPVMKFLFRHDDPVVLSRAEELTSIQFEMEPSIAVLNFYDLTVTGAEPTTLTLAELRTGGAPVLVNPTQIALDIEWVITERIRVQATYSFEVRP